MYAENLNIYHTVNKIAYCKLFWNDLDHFYKYY